MKSLHRAIIFILSIGIIHNIAFSENEVKNDEGTIEWINNIVKDSGKQVNHSNYIFHCSGTCYGSSWSMIYSDSAGLHVLKGTTRNRQESEDTIPLDTLKILMDNSKTIKWALDSLANEASLLNAHMDNSYSPLFSKLVIVNDNEVNYEVYKIKKFTGKCSKKFNNKLQKLGLLMLWLEYPNLHPFLPIPNDGIKFP